jgi:membrane protein DedA with SNARE-associated domain
VVALAAGLIGTPSLSDAIADAPETLGDGTYAFGSGMALLEFSSLLGVAIPFEVGVVVSGAVAGDGEVDLVPLVVLVWAAASVGELINFWLGRRYGRVLLERSGPRYGVTPARLAALEQFFDRRGSIAVLVGRFIPLVRSSMPFLAGTSTMRFGRFAPLVVIGNLGWAALFCGLGFAFYHSADEVVDRVVGIGWLTFALVVGAFALVVLRRRRVAARRAG